MARKPDQLTGPSHAALAGHPRQARQQFFDRRPLVTQRAVENLYDEKRSQRWVAR